MYITSDTISFARKFGSRNKKKKIVSASARNQENENRIRKLLAISKEGREWLNTGLRVSKWFK